MFLSSHGAAVQPCRYPAPSCIPVMATVQVAARYQAARVGGDFFEFLTPRAGRLVFLLADIAGRREQALDLASYLQDAFRARVPELFAAEVVNEADAITTLTHDLNRTLLEAAGGVRCAPGFLVCYNEASGTLTYINAGHMPGLLKDSAGLGELQAGGLPLGLFSHVTHDAQVRVLAPGAALLLVSKGLPETRQGREEFGLERVKGCLNSAPVISADEICERLLSAVRSFASSRRPRTSFLGLGERNGAEAAFQNDVTSLALVRRT
jgi:serine phosphatase RsbU (regulator of sigma subunit)